MPAFGELCHRMIKVAAASRGDVACHNSDMVILHKNPEEADAVEMLRRWAIRFEFHCVAQTHASERKCCGHRYCGVCKGTQCRIVLIERDLAEVGTSLLHFFESFFDVSEGGTHALQRKEECLNCHSIRDSQMLIKKLRVVFVYLFVGLKALNPYYSLFSRAILRPIWIDGGGNGWLFATSRTSPLEIGLAVGRLCFYIFGRSRSSRFVTVAND